jgi:hypothetical protein
MTHDEIVNAAVIAEAEKHGVLSKTLVIAALDGTAIKVIDGEALQSEVRAHVARVRSEMPELFRNLDWSKASAKDKAAKEAQLRGRAERESASVPTWLKTLDTSKLTRAELNAVGCVLSQPSDRISMGVCERAAARLGISTDA